MPDFAVLSAALASLKTAADIVKALRETDSALQQAELKMRLADLVSTLADAKLQFVEVQSILQDREKRIRELEEAFELKEQLVRQHDAYYRLGTDGRATGQPFCLRCWDVEHKCRQLVAVSSDHRRKICPACKHDYMGILAPGLKPSVAESTPSE